MSKIGTLAHTSCPTRRWPFEDSEGNRSGPNYLAEWACFLGNIPMGLLLLYLGAKLFGSFSHSDVREIKALVIAAILVVLYMSTVVRVRWEGPFGVAVLVASGMTVGVGLTVFLWYIGLLIVAVAGFLGVVLGVISLGRCLGRGDSTRWTMAVFACIPQIMAMCFLR